MKNSVLVRLGIILAILAVCLFVFYPKGSSLSLKKSVPSKGSAKVLPEKPIQLTFSQQLDTYAPYKMFSIAPKTDGTVKVSGATMTFTPAFKLIGNTNYTVTVYGAQSIAGKLAKNVEISFKTVGQNLSDFEKSLPYHTDTYTVDKLEDGSITLTILSAPADKVQVEAIAFLKTKGVDTSKITINKALSSQD